MFGRDIKAAELARRNVVHPWPDPEVSDREFIYLHSQRFDKFFRMNCELGWTADRTIDYIVSPLALPWRKEIPELGMSWTFGYKLVYGEQSVSLRRTLRESGIVVGSTVNPSSGWSSRKDRDRHALAHSHAAVSRTAALIK